MQVALVSPSDGLIKVGGKERLAIRSAKEVSGERHSTGLERTQMKFLPATVASDQGAEKPGLGSGKRLQPPVEEAGLLCPPQKVSAAEAPRRPGRPTASEHHVPARLIQILRDLASRLATTDDQHLSRGQCLFVAVIVHVDLGQLGWQRRSRRWPVRTLIGTGRHDHRIRMNVASRRAKHEPTTR